MDFLWTYFLWPIMTNGSFNPVNSFAYGLVLIAGVWGVFRLLGLLGIKPDRRLMLSVTPFIAYAAATRTLRDLVYSQASATEGFLLSFPAHMQAMQQQAYGFVLAAAGSQAFASADSYIIAWFASPGSYLITAAFALTSLLISVLVQRRAGIEYWKTMAAIGTVLFVTNAAMVPVRSLMPLLYIVPVAAGWAFLFFGLGSLARSGRLKALGKRAEAFAKTILTRDNALILSVHLFDATATFFAISSFTTQSGQGYSEQHFLSQGLMPFLGPQVMFLLKLLVVVPVLYFIDRHVQDKDFGSFLKLAVFILGLAPASRNLARLMAGV